MQKIKIKVAAGAQINILNRGTQSYVNHVTVEVPASELPVKYGSDTEEDIQDIEAITLTIPHQLETELDGSQVILASDGKVYALVVTV